MRTILNWSRYGALMAYPGNHMLTVFGGTLFTNEEWACSLRSTPGAAGNAAEVAEVVRAWFAGNAQISSVVRLGYVKHNEIGPNGRYANNVTGEEFYLPEVAAGSQPPAGPPQVALVATLETGLARGLAHRGRIFLPTPPTNPDSTGRISVNAANLQAVNVAELITDLNSLASFGQVAVYSDVREGAVNVVTGVTCGRVLDTMRSRRAQLEEERPPATPVGGL